MRETPQVDWQSYATVYDTMADFNPAYQQLLALFQDTIRHWSIEPNALLVDLGAGTGNFSMELARSFPHCRVTHLEPDRGMNSIARRKRLEQAVVNLEIMESSVDRASFVPGSLAAITTVHALYTFPDPRGSIAQMFEWLRPGGYLFACDVGRMSGTLKWAPTILGEMYRRRGLLGAARLGLRSWEILRQNRRIVRTTEHGTYWSHTHAEFREVFESVGFKIESSAMAFRGDSDIVVASKPG